MKAEIEVLRPGLFSTLQDLGRSGYLRFGVPISGAMDNYAATMANLSLHNHENAAVLEITQTGPKLKFTADTIIAIFGADLSPSINKMKIEINRTQKIKAGDELSFGRRLKGCRAYLAISGGFETEKVLGSQSWYEGVTAEYRLEKNMKLPYKALKEPKPEFHAALKVKKDYFSNPEIEVFPGPEFHLLNKKQRERLESQNFTVGQNNNRMAIQLKEVLKNNLNPIITGPVLPGTVQLTPGGTLIVLMRDCQTTGGYPRIFQISEQGINTLAQKVVGDEIEFRMVI